MRAFTTLSLALILIVSGCTKSGGDSDSDDGGGGGGGGGREVGMLDCGVVAGAKVLNPVHEGDGTLVRVVQVISPQYVAVREVTTLNGGSVLVQLQGIEEDASLRAAAMSVLDELASSGDVVLIRAGDNCNVTVAGGGQGIVGQLVNSSSQSFSEVLISRGVVNVSAVDACRGSQIASCLQSLHGTEQETAGPLDAFLWKPESDSDGKLAVHTGPYGTIVTVNGETGRNAGAGNGYGSLSRFGRPGCAYGSPRIQVRDESSGLAYTVGGKTTFTVPNPCQRNCLSGGGMQYCPKN